jgi:hypothetical protein
MEGEEDSRQIESEVALSVEEFESRHRRRSGLDLHENFSGHRLRNVQAGTAKTTSAKGSS